LEKSFVKLFEEQNPEFDVALHKLQFALKIHVRLDMVFSQKTIVV